MRKTGEGGEERGGGAEWGKREGNRMRMRMRRRGEEEGEGEREAAFSFTWRLDES